MALESVSRCKVRKYAPVQPSWYEFLVSLDSNNFFALCPFMIPEFFSSRSIEAVFIVRSFLVS